MQINTSKQRKNALYPHSYSKGLYGDYDKGVRGMISAHPNTKLKLQALDNYYMRFFGGHDEI